MQCPGIPAALFAAAAGSRRVSTCEQSDLVRDPRVPTPGQVLDRNDAVEVTRASPMECHHPRHWGQVGPQQRMMGSPTLAVALERRKGCQVGIVHWIVLGRYLTPHSPMSARPSTSAADSNERDYPWPKRATFCLSPH